MLTNIILRDINLKIIALICRLLFRNLREKKRLFIFGQTLFVSGLKVHLDTELKIGLREKALLNSRRGRQKNKLRLFDFLTFRICGQKVHLDSEKRNRKLGLRVEVKITTFVRTENCQTENSI